MNLYCIDAPSVKRHKERWHNTDGKISCTIVPARAPEVKQLKEQYTLRDDMTSKVPLNNEDSASSTHFAGDADGSNNSYSEESTNVQSENLTILKT